MRSLVIETERAWQSLGGVKYGPTKAEEASMKHRRSLYVVEDLKAGDVLTQSNIRAIRPGAGLSPKYLELLLGKTVKQDIKKGTPLHWDLL